MDIDKNKERYDDGEVEIDLLELLYALKKKLVLLIAAMLAGAVIAGIYTETLITPQYSATATMLVLTKETTLASLADLQLGSELTNDYRILILSNSVLNDVIDKMGLHMDHKELRADITIDNPSDSRILEITVDNPDPQAARDIVDELAHTAADFIGDQMEVAPPKIIEDVEIPETPTSPSLSRNVLLGGMIGLILSAGIVVLMTVMNDRIRSEDDIEKYLGISALGSIPDRRDYISGKSKKKKKKRESLQSSPVRKRRRSRHR